MSYTKKKFALWLTPGTKELVERCYQLDNSQSQSEFIERAIQFYTGYLEAEQDGTYLPVTLSAVLEGSSCIVNRAGRIAGCAGRSSWETAVQDVGGDVYDDAPYGTRH